MSSCQEVPGVCSGQDWCCGNEEPTVPTKTSSTVASTSSASNEPTTSAENIDCKSICDGEDTNIVGECCEDFYCDCIKEEAVICEGDQVFCNNLEMVEIGCNDLYGQSCEGADFCCKDEIPTTKIPTTSSTSTVSNEPTTSIDNIDCASICNGVDTGNVGDCCSDIYCDCTSEQPMKCTDNLSFCTTTNICSAQADACDDGLTWCCVPESTNYNSKLKTNSDSVSNEHISIADTIDCKSICNGANVGVAGDCCSSFYCDCSSNQPIYCDEESVFCNTVGGCEWIGQSCNEDSKFFGWAR